MARPKDSSTTAGTRHEARLARTVGPWDTTHGHGEDNAPTSRTPRVQPDWTPRGRSAQRDRDD